MLAAPKLARWSNVIDSAPATSSSPRMESTIMPRRRFQSGRVYQRGSKWVGSYRDYEANPETGKRTRHTITFDATISSERAAKAALQPYLDDYNARAKANLKPSAPSRGEKSVRALITEWSDKILPNRKPGGARASLSHIRTDILPQLGELPLREMNLSQPQTFVTAVGRRVDRRKTAENVHGTLGSILNLGRKWGYAVPNVEKSDIVFPADKKPQPQIFFFDADTAARIINVAPYPFNMMFLIAAL